MADSGKTQSTTLVLIEVERSAGGGVLSSEVENSYLWWEGLGQRNHQNMCAANGVDEVVWP